MENESRTAGGEGARSLDAPAVPSIRIGGAVAFAAGLFAQVAQIVMFREMMAACRGTEIFFGVVMAAGFLWTALGGAAANRVFRGSRRRPPRQTANRSLFLAAALFTFNGLLLTGQIALARYRAPSWGGAEDLTFLESVGVALISTAPVALLCGLQVVLALNAVPQEEFARLYQLETLGAVGGGLLFSFVLVEYAPAALVGPALCAVLSLILLWAVLAPSSPRGRQVGPSRREGQKAADRPESFSRKEAIPDERNPTGDRSPRPSRREGPTFLPVTVIAVSPSRREGPAGRPAASLLAICSAGLILEMVALAGFGITHLDRRLQERRWSARFPGFELLASRDSRYGQLAALKHPAANQISLYMDGGLVQTISPGDTASFDERNEALFAVAQHPNAKRVLLVGGTLGMLPREILNLGVSRLDALEMDPSLATLAEQFRPLPKDPHFHLHKDVDGRYFIKRARDRYDLILLKTPAPLSGSVNRYYTREFFEEARNALDRDGALIASVPAAANYEGEAVATLSASILKTLQSVFPEVLVAPGEVHTFVAGTRPGIVSLDPEVLGRRIARRGAAPNGIGANAGFDPASYCAALFKNLIITNQIERLRQTLTATPARANTDMRPIAYQYALLVWNQTVSASSQSREPGVDSGSNAFFRWITGLTFLGALWLPGIIAALSVAAFGLDRPWAAGRNRTSGTFLILTASAAVGFFGMGAETALLFAFQNAYGFVYAHVGILLAAFMAGLALGARALSGRSAGPSARLTVGLLFLMAAFCGAVALLLPFLGRLQSYGVLYGAFLLLMAAAGFLDGAAFPPLTRLLRNVWAIGQDPVRAEGSARAEGAAGWVYAADLAGASAGALAPGAIGIPLLGAGLTLANVALVLAVAAFALAALESLRATHRVPR